MVDAFERAAARAETESRQRRNERRARGNRKGFRIHATVFVAVQILILAVWVLQVAVGRDDIPLVRLCAAGVGCWARCALRRGARQLQGQATLPMSVRTPGLPTTATEKTGVRDG